MKSIRSLSLRSVLAVTLAFGSSAAPIVLPVGVASLVITQSSCKDSDLDKAAKASRELAGDVVTAEKAVAAVFNGGLITIEQKDALAVHFKAIAKAGDQYNELVKTLSEQAKNGTLPANALAILSAEFDHVVAPFLTLLDDLGKLSAGASQQISLGIAALKAAVVAIAAIMAARGSKTAQNNVKELNLRGVYA